MPLRTDFTPGEFCWIDMIAHDIEAAVEWYGALFGWTVEMQPTPGGPRYGFLKKGDHVLGGIGQMPDEMKAAGAPQAWNCYVATEDCEATEARAKELGGSVMFPTTEIPGKGRLAFFTDPEGAVIPVWQTTEDDDVGVLTEEHGAMIWCERMTRDVDAVKAFYGDLFGWEFGGRPDHLVARIGDRDAGGVMPMGEAYEGVPPHWLLYFRADDCAAVAGAAAASGGTVVVPTMDLPIGRFAILMDPAGGAFALLEPKAS